MVSSGVILSVQDMISCLLYPVCSSDDTFPANACSKLVMSTNTLLASAEPGVGVYPVSGAGSIERK